MPKASVEADETFPLSRSEAASRAVREAIFTGRFPPGAPLRFQELQGLCGMSVSPVREALTRLVGEGLVEAEHNRGYRVATLSRHDLDDLVPGPGQQHGCRGHIPCLSA